MCLSLDCIIIIPYIALKVNKLEPTARVELALDAYETPVLATELYRHGANGQNRTDNIGLQNRGFTFELRWQIKRR